MKFPLLGAEVVKGPIGFPGNTPIRKATMILDPGIVVLAVHLGIGRFARPQEPHIGSPQPDVKRVQSINRGCPKNIKIL